MIYLNEQIARESIDSLEQALKGNELTELTETESRQNILDNLVNIVHIDKLTKTLPNGSRDYSVHSVGSGLRITEDGFIITTYHNIENFLEDWKRMIAESPITSENVSLRCDQISEKYVALDRNRNACPIDIYFWLSNPAYDVALIKTMGPRGPKPVKFKIRETELRIGEDVMIAGFRDQFLFNQYGRVLIEGYNATISNFDGSIKGVTYDAFLTDAYTVPGFSGGAFMDIKGNLAGIDVFGQKIHGSNLGKAGGAKIKHFLDLINTSLPKLRERVESVVLT